MSLRTVAITRTGRTCRRLRDCAGEMASTAILPSHLRLLASPLSRCDLPLEHPVGRDMRSSSLAVDIPLANVDLWPALARGDLFGRDVASQTQQPLKQFLWVIVFADAGPVFWRQRNGQAFI